MKILVIDDDPSFCEMVSRYFHRRGHRVSAASNAEAAQDLLLDQDIHVIILDNNLGSAKAVGIKVLEDLKKRSGAPIIFVTAFPNEDVLLDARHMGAYCALRKPFEMKILEKTITEAINSPHERSLNATIRRDRSPR